MNKRSFGKTGENTAAIYLENKGFTIVGHNVYVGKAEIDLIAKNEDFFLFVEVKTRRQRPESNSFYGRPGSALNYNKKIHLLAAAEGYLHMHPDISGSLQPRIDLIEVYVDPSSETYRVLDIVHIPNAVHK